MKHTTFLFVFLLLSMTGFSQKLTEISGFAPAYVGQELEVYQILDFLTHREERIASTTVKADSSFSVVFNLDKTQKLLIKSRNNKGFLYVDPGVHYNVFVPEKNKIDPYNPSGNFVEISLFDLDKKDINFKVLELNRWVDEFIARYYTKNNAESKYFVARLDTFKINVENYYKADTLNDFFNYYLKFSIAKLDDLRFLGNRNQYEKYDFYIRRTPVHIQHDQYMDYINHFYSKIMNRFASEINNKVYLGIVKSSPTAIYNALGNEYTLKTNYKLRELIMLQILSEVYKEKDYPQTNILTVLDSVSKFGLFPENKLIAQNLLFRLKELAPGAKAPDYHFVSDGKSYTLQSNTKKYTYLIFADPTSLENNKQLNLLKPIYEKYKDRIQFLVVTKESNTSVDDFNKFKNDYPFETVRVSETNSIFSNYNTVISPYYVLIDPFGYLVQAPALGPIPNGNRESIDNTFFQIQRAQKNGNNGSDR